MDKTMIESFIKKAQEQGLTKEQAEKFVEKNFPGTFKTAEENLDTFTDNVLKVAGVEKSSGSVGYVQGVVKAAVESGYDINKAAEIAVSAVSSNPTFKKVASAQRIAPEKNEKLAAYSDAFVKAATAYGFSVGQGIDLLNYVLKQADTMVDKTAGGHHGGGDPSGGMGGAGGPPPPPPGPGGPPGMGAGLPPMDPGSSGSGDDVIAQLIQLLQNNPELAQQLLSEAQGAGPGGPGGAGGPPGMGGGAGGPPPPGGPPGMGGGGAPDPGMFKNLPAQ